MGDITDDLTSSVRFLGTIQLHWSDVESAKFRRKLNALRQRDLREKAALAYYAEQRYGSQTQQAYLDRTHGKVPEPTSGEVRIADVLLKIFPYLRPCRRTLFAVSQVCRSWRKASNHLPQWADPVIRPRFVQPGELIEFTPLKLADKTKKNREPGQIKRRLPQHSQFQHGRSDSSAEERQPLLLNAATSSSAVTVLIGEDEATSTTPTRIGIRRREEDSSFSSRAATDPEVGKFLRDMGRHGAVGTSSDDDSDEDGGVGDGAASDGSSTEQSPPTTLVRSRATFVTRCQEIEKIINNRITEEQWEGKKSRGYFALGHCFFATMAGFILLMMCGFAGSLVTASSTTNIIVVGVADFIICVFVAVFSMLIGLQVANYLQLRAMRSVSPRSRDLVGRVIMMAVIIYPVMFVGSMLTALYGVIEGELVFAETKQAFNTSTVCYPSVGTAKAPFYVTISVYEIDLWSYDAKEIYQFGRFPPVRLYYNNSTNNGGVPSPATNDTIVYSFIKRSRWIDGNTTAGHCVAPWIPVARPNPYLQPGNATTSAGAHFDGLGSHQWWSMVKTQGLHLSQQDGMRHSIWFRTSVEMDFMPMPDLLRGIPGEDVDLLTVSGNRTTPLVAPQVAGPHDLIEARIHRIKRREFIVHMVVIALYLYSLVGMIAVSGKRGEYKWFVVHAVIVLVTCNGILLTVFGAVCYYTPASHHGGSLSVCLTTHSSAAVLFAAGIAVTVLQLFVILCKLR